MVSSIGHIYTAVTADQQVPSKVLDSVQYLCAKNEKELQQFSWESFKVRPL